MSARESFGFQTLGGLIEFPKSLTGTASKATRPYSQSKSTSYAYDHVGQWIKVSPNGKISNANSLGVFRSGRIIHY